MEAPIRFPIQVGLGGFCWAGDCDTRGSTSGCIFSYAGDAILRKSCRQRVVACSSTEVEYYALGEARKESIWLSRVGSDIALGLGISFKDIQVENTGALQLACNDPRHGRTKHIDIRYHHIMECVEEGRRVVSFLTYCSILLFHCLSPLFFLTIIVFCLLCSSD